MDCPPGGGPPIAAWIAVGALVALLIGWHVVAGRRGRRNLQQLADRVGGTFDPGSALALPTLHLNRPGVSATLSYSEGGEHDSGRLELDVALPAPVPLRLSPEHAPAKLLKFFGAGDVQVGDDDFDRAFVVRAPSSAAAGRLLGPDVRRALLELRNFASGALHLDWTPGGLRVVKEGRHFVRYDRLETFFTLALRVAGLLRSAGETFGVPSSADDPAACAVCGEPARDAACARCSRPYHLPCWDYAGHCALADCRGARLRPCC